MIEVGVLGELRVVVDGIDVTPAARKERAMLALIAIEPGRVVSTSRLLEELWPDLPPERGRHACQVRVAEIRKHLARAGAGHLLESVAPGYRLAIDPEAVDARRFATLVEDGRARTAAGDPTGAAETLREALALWRGEAFADALGSPALEAEAARLEEARLGAIEARIAAELADGCHQQLVPELDGLVAAQPLREGLWEHRVLALYRCGRQAEALRACAAIRDRLRDELGVDPGPGLRDMEAAVLAQSPTLDWHPAEPAASPHPTDAPTPPGALIDDSPGNLPTAFPLVGRQAELARVVELLRTQRLVTVTGPPGVGKSRLALAVAHAVADEVADGVWLVELAPLADPSSLVAAIAGVLPLPGMPLTTAELVHQIGPRQLLILLDNCEHVVEAVAVLVARLMAACPSIRVLCTSQETLAVEREHVWPLEPLAEDAAVDLFDERARAVRPDVVDDPDTVAVIVRRLDCLPLAIELAAARASTVSPAEIADQLDDRFHLLAGGLRGRPPRHRALAAMVDWSHDLLGPRQRRLFRRLGIFSGTFTRDAATEIADVEADGSAALGDDLDQLVRRSLVVADSSSATTRHRLLETLRHYALDRLADAGETETLGRRHAEWYARHAAEYSAVRSPEEALWLARGLAELDNFRGAVAFAVENDDIDLAVRLVGPLWSLNPLWHPELLRLARRVLAMPGAADHPDVGYVHMIVALLAPVVGELGESERSVDEALRNELDEDAWGHACREKAALLAYRGDFEGGAPIYDLAWKRLLRPRNLVLQRASAFGGEAYTGILTGVDPDRVIASADATGIPDVRSHVRSMVALGMVGRDRAIDTVPLMHEALEIVEPGLNRRAVNIAKQMLALVSATGPEPLPRDDLSDRAAKAIDLDREYPSGMGFVLIGLVISAQRLGHVAEAAWLVGYLAGHLEELELTRRSAEVMAGGPLNGFVTPAAEREFERGRSMTREGLMAELRRLAGPVGGSAAPDAQAAQYS